MSRVYLSPPDVGDDERKLLLDAFDSNWIAPLGPHVDAFEAEFAQRLGMPYACALSSGSAALHLALLLSSVGPGDEVLVPTLTFVATANAVCYTGAKPVFVDSDPATWQVDPALVEEELSSRVGSGRSAAALVAVDLYGQTADYDRLVALCDRHGVLLIEDAAEALGATYRDSAAGAFGVASTFSFNGNKILTTSGGGMLVSRSRELVDRARHLASQARQPEPHYEHRELGFNYRMSNLLAAVGRAQLGWLDERLARRRRINAMYRDALGSLPGIEFMPQAPYGVPSCWLTCILVDPDGFGATRDDLMTALEAEDIESRPTWKPMHLQPVFEGTRVVGGSVSEAIFERGLCLPSGSNLSDGNLDRVVDVTTRVCGSQR